MALALCSLHSHNVLETDFEVISSFWFKTIVFLEDLKKGAKFLH